MFFNQLINHLINQWINKKVNKRNNTSKINAVLWDINKPSSQSIHQSIKHWSLRICELLNQSMKIIPASISGHRLNLEILVSAGASFYITPQLLAIINDKLWWFLQAKLDGRRENTSGDLCPRGSVTFGDCVHQVAVPSSVWVGSGGVVVYGKRHPQCALHWGVCRCEDER